MVSCLYMYMCVHSCWHIWKLEVDISVCLYYFPHGILRQGLTKNVMLTIFLSPSPIVLLSLPPSVVETITSTPVFKECLRI